MSQCTLNNTGLDIMTIGYVTVDQGFITLNSV